MTTPLITMSSGYIGSVNSWLKLWHEIIYMKKDIIQLQKSEYDKNFSEKQLLCLESIILNFEVVELSENGKFTKSIMDFYYSGSDRILCALMDQLDRTKNLNKFFQLSKLETIKNLNKIHAKYFKNSLVEGIRSGNTKDWQYYKFDFEKYYQYREFGAGQWAYCYEPKWKDYFSNSLVIGYFNVGQLIWVIPDQVTKDGEWEALICTPSADNSVERYCSFAELIFYSVICGLFFPSLESVKKNEIIDHLASILFDLDVIKNQKRPNWSEWELIKPK
ncbi:MAG: hypothetical protein KGO49_08010 [Gammaproteobacteria bacterium]|nr:hypothetical protein [Gammaproteobacteria bacterium]